MANMSSAISKMICKTYTFNNTFKHRKGISEVECSAQVKGSGGS